MKTKQNKITTFGPRSRVHVGMNQYKGEQALQGILISSYPVPHRYLVLQKKMQYLATWDLDLTPLKKKRKLAPTTENNEAKPWISAYRSFVFCWLTAAPVFCCRKATFLQKIFSWCKRLVLKKSLNMAGRNRKKCGI